jgi:NAD-dependent dihydropyrimidine dehydrogenase PreA subunit
LKLLHAFLYGRFPSKYIKFRDKILANSPQKVKKHIANNYHGKVIKLDDAMKIITINHEIELKNLEKVIPYDHAKDLILKSPDSIIAYDCMCRTVRKEPCLPIDVCIVIGEPFAGAINSMQPDKTRKISREEALNILEEEHKRGHVHTAYFKDIMLDRFYAICNCCKCCCSSMKALLEYDIPMIAPSGYTAHISEGCNGCGECVRFCQFGAIKMENGKAINIYEKCFGCGICQSKCPEQAISLIRDPEKGDPLDITALTGNIT